MGGAVVLPRSVSRERRVSEWTLGSRDVMEEAAAFITDGQSCKDSTSAAPQHLASARKWQIHGGMQRWKSQVGFVSPFYPFHEFSVDCQRERDAFFAEIRSEAPF